MIDTVPEADLIWNCMRGDPPVVRFPAWPTTFDFAESAPPEKLPVVTLDCTRYRTSGEFTVSAPGFHEERKLEADMRFWRHDSHLIHRWAFDEIRDVMRRALAHQPEEGK